MPIDIERLLLDNPIPIDAESIEDVHHRVFGGSDRRVAPAHYVVHEELGRGRYGYVHRATDSRLSREVALKLIPFDGSRRLARIEREAHALARLNHPNIVTVFEKGIADVGSYFLATELVRGTRLDAWMAAPERSLAEILEIFAQAADGLEHAHLRGLVHRDFKPNNAIVDEQGRLRILDFGLAKVFEGASLDDASTTRQPRSLSGDASSALADATVSEHGLARTADPYDEAARAHDHAVGTPEYAPPEQLEGKEVDPRSDQFSLCVALFEACHGFRPFSGRTLFELSEQIHQQRFVPGRPRHRVPRWLTRLLRRGLSPNPRDRFESVGRIATILRARIGRRVPAWVALAAGIVLTLGTVVLVKAWTTPEPPSIVVAWDGAWAPEDTVRLEQRFGPGLVERLEAYEQGWHEAKHRFPSSPAREAMREANACMRAGRQRFAELVHGLLPDDPGAEEPPSLALADGRLEALWLTRMFDPSGCLEALPRWEQDEALVDGLRLAQSQRLEGHPHDAIETLLPLLDRTTTSGAAEGFVRYELGIAKTHVGDRHAIQDLREAIRHHGHDSGFYAAALARLVEARVALEPDTTHGLDEALDDLALLEGNEPSFERTRGQALLRLGRYPAAEAAFAAARVGFEALPTTRYREFMIASCVLDRAYAQSNLPEPHVELDPLEPALATIRATLGVAHPVYLQHATQVARLMGDEGEPERGRVALAPAIAALTGSRAPLRLVTLARAERLRLDIDCPRSPDATPWDQWLPEADAIEALLDGHQETPGFWSERDMFHVREILFSASATFVEEQPSSTKALENAVTAVRRVERLTSAATRMGRAADACGYLEALDGLPEGSPPVLLPAIRSALPPHSLEILAQSWTLCR